MTASITQENDRRDRFFKISISLFIAVHFALTIFWLSPPSALRDKITSAIRPVWDFCGLTQRWTLFSPAIRTINSHCVVMVTFEDGTSTQWPMPRFEQMGDFEKFRKDKFRKWASDNAEWHNYKQFWPEFARYIGRLHYSADGPKPMMLMMTRYQSDVPKPETGISRLDIQKRYKYSTLFSYQFKPGDFQQ